LLPRANAAACPQLAKADFASSSQHVRERQRIAALDAEVDALQRQALALGAEPTGDIPPWVLLGVKIAARRGVSNWLSPWRSDAMELCRFLRPLALLGTFFAGRRL
jgi:hypothetical protein